MQGVLDVINYLLSSGPAMLAAFAAALVAFIAFFQLIPGEQPEKFLQSVVDFIAKFSKK